MPAPDARNRTKVTLNPAKVLSSSIPSNQLPRIFLSDLLFVLSLYAGKEWLLGYEVGVFWVLMRMLACGGLGVLLWVGMTGQLAKRKSVRNIEWSVLGTASLLLFVQQACLFTALYRLSSTRVILFTHNSALWTSALINPSSARKMIWVVVALFVSLVSDTQLDVSAFSRCLPAYGALVIHSMTSIALDHTLGVLSPSLGNTVAIAATTFGASLFALPFYAFRTVLLGFPTTPVLPLTSLAALPVIAYTILFLFPLTTRTLDHLLLARQHFIMSHPSIMVMSVVIAALVFVQFPTWADLFVGVFLYVGMYPSNTEALTQAPRTPALKILRAYLKTILSNPESRKIFYFLLLNMCYMLVQMLYGVWTNSLGLISDAIHMAFDCMAIGVGLFASVMATWDPNERFTYGYGRIETLSGFANGIFLILISIFIVFEAVQRILDPPEINTNQLLLVSTLGLAVNLFGMFAMGGHHHHGGHSHSHSHSHSPSLSHSHSQSSGHSHKTQEHRHGDDIKECSESCESHKHTPNNDASIHSSLHHSHSHSPAAPPSPLPLSIQLQLPDFDEQEPSTSQDTHFTCRGPVETPAIVLSDHDDYLEQTHLTVPQQPHSLLTPDARTKVELLRGASNQSSPLTPHYTFGFDDHIHEHGSQHTPNLHDHSHVHSHEGHHGHSHNMRGVFLHVMADTLGSVGVIVSTLLIQFYGWSGFDPIASLLIAILIAASVIPLVLDTGRILSLDVGSRDVVIHQTVSSLSSIEGLASYSAPRFWPKDSSSLIGSIHIQLASPLGSVDLTRLHSDTQATHKNVDRVVERVDTALRQGIPGLEELTIQVEMQH